MDAILGFLSYLPGILIALSILVFVHELGHFLAARLFGMRVDKFSIGFPPKIIGKKVGDTEYVIGAVPLGGYVKIAGMVDESMDAGFAETEPQPDEYRSKPVWQRIVVITAGVIFNLIFAVMVYVGLKAAYGEEYIPAENVEAVYVEDGSIAYDMGLRTGDRLVAANGKALVQFEDLYSPTTLAADPLTLTVERGGQEETFTGPEQLLSKLNQPDRAGIGDPFGLSFLPALIGGVQQDSPADQAGIEPGDRVVAVGGAPIQFWTELPAAVTAAEGRAVPVQIARDPAADAPEGGTRVAQPGTRELAIYEVQLTPRYDDVAERYLLGVTAPNSAQLREEYGVAKREYGPIEAIGAGAKEAWVNTAFQATAIGRLFTGREDVRQSVGGPVAIAKAAKTAADSGARSFWNLVAMLSIALALFNILPIPALDGGHLVFLLYEGITRREPSLKVKMWVQQAGFFLLLAFMVFVIFNDISRF